MLLKKKKGDTRFTIYLCMLYAVIYAEQSCWRIIAKKLNVEKCRRNWCCIPDTCISNNSNCHSSWQPSKTTSQPRWKMCIPIKEVIRFRFGINPSTNDNGDNQPVNTQHSCHNHGHYGLHNQLRPHHTHRCYAHPALGCPICSSHACSAKLKTKHTRMTEEWRSQSSPVWI